MRSYRTTSVSQDDRRLTRAELSRITGLPAASLRAILRGMPRSDSATAATLAAARPAGSLRYTRTGKRIFYKGARVSAWLETAAATASKPRQTAARRDGVQ
jgi:hypothetical protein